MCFWALSLLALAAGVEEKPLMPRLLGAMLPREGQALQVPSVRPRLRARAAHRAPQVRAAEEEEVTFDFGDAGTVSKEASVAVEAAEQEVELTEKQKEIARLRAAEKFMMQDTGNARCRTCSYVYKWEEGAPGLPKKTPFNIVPDSWACPTCKSPKAFFDPEQIEIAGFADNQAYGIGTNTWTEAQKSNAIFGGLAAFFILFLAGYGLN